MNLMDYRPWGWWNQYLAEPGYSVKRLVLYPGKQFSMQRHHLRDEHWVVVSGQGVATLEGRETSLVPGGTFFIPRTAVHRLLNVGSTDLVVIEVQMGVCREDDIERLADDFGRS